MGALRSFCAKYLQGIVTVPEYYGVVEYELPKQPGKLQATRVELLLMDAVGDERGTTARAVEQGKVYAENKTNIAQKAKETLSQIKAKVAEAGISSSVLRDLTLDSLVINPLALTDTSQPLFFLIDQ